MCVCVCSFTFSKNALDPNLALHARQAAVPVGMVGFVLLTMASVYANQGSKDHYVVRVRIYFGILICNHKSVIVSLKFR